MTSSTKYLVEAGRTSPETRLITIKPSPRRSRRRRGRSSCQISGSAWKILVFFAGFGGLGVNVEAKCFGFPSRWIGFRGSRRAVHHGEQISESPRFEIARPSVPHIERELGWPRMDPQSTA